MGAKRAAAPGALQVMEAGGGGQRVGVPLIGCAPTAARGGSSRNTKKQRQVGDAGVGSVDGMWGWGGMRRAGGQALAAGTGTAQVPGQAAASESGSVHGVG